MFLNNTPENWLISLAIIVSAVILNKLLSLFNRKVILKITRKTANRFDNILFTTLETPLLLGIMLVAIWVALDRLSLGKDTENIISKSYRILAVLNITWFAARLLVALAEEYLTSSNPKNAQRKVHLDIHMIALVKKTVLFIIWTLGGVMALSNVGVNIGALLGTLGIGGMAVALAAQDTVKNVFGGFTILMDGTFRIGDRIKIGEFDGFVENIGIRSTRIRTMEKRVVIIPNYKIVEGPVQNISEEPMRQVITRLGLVYSTSPKQMQEAIDILKSLPDQVTGVDTDDVAAVFSEYGESALVLKFIYHINSEGNVLTTPSEMNLKILHTFNAAGLEFAFPTQTVYIQKNS